MRDETPPRTVRRYASEPEGDDSVQRDRWLISFADLMTLLFALFVVLYASADRERGRAVAEALAGQISGGGALDGGSGVLPGSLAVTEARAAVERVLLVNEALRARARVSTTPGGFIISLAEAGFFAPGEAAVRADAQALLVTLAETLNTTPTLIRVEGHTDATPIATARYPSNWELSSGRASAVLAELVAQGVAPARLSVAGYASEKPVADNSTAEGRALNRRVDLVVLQTP
jgi:chemotaxis protein MotB